MQTRTTTYACDHCKKKVDRKSGLRRFAVSQTYSRVISFDLCEPCEAELVVLLGDYVPEGEDPATLARSAQAGGHVTSAGASTNTTGSVSLLA